MTSVLVKDQLHLVQCFECQKFGHKNGSTYSNIGEMNVCLYCSGDHRSKVCKVKIDQTKHKCSNGSASEVPVVRAKANGHITISKECPVVQQEIKSRINRTAERTVYQIKLG